MATSEVKSYRVTITRKAVPSLNPEVAVIPFTSAHTIFQVPAGKTWLVIKMWHRWVSSTAKPLESVMRIEKTRSDGEEAMLFMMSALDDASDSWTTDGLAWEVEGMKDLVFEDQEMLRAVFTTQRDAIVVMQFEMSCHEFTP